MAYEPQSHVITSIRECTEDVKLFRVKTGINPMPGQFFQVSLLGKGESALASCSFEKKYVDLLVRRVGNVTQSMFRLKKGQKIYIRGPYGKGYDLDAMKGKNIILVAGGTGLAPITSLIDYIEKNRKDFGEITIYFAFRDDEHILLYERIKKWEKIFNLFLCLDKESSKVRCRVGHVQDIIAKPKTESKDTIAVLCGPEGMMAAVSDKLKTLGIGNDKVFWNMERRMECAIGSCGRCLLQDVYVCKDGPVFRYDKIKEKIENESKG